MLLKISLKKHHFGEINSCGWVKNFKRAATRQYLANGGYEYLAGEIMAAGMNRELTEFILKVWKIVLQSCQKKLSKLVEFYLL